MAQPLLFISYRRTDAQQAAFGLYVQLRARIGIKSVFMDRSGISPGDVWAERLRGVISQSTVVLALIGLDWLTSADEYGRRRLDMPDDWVRNELLAALDSGKPLIPILLDPLTQMPAEAGLPEALQPLRNYQAFTLRNDHWDPDLDELVRHLIETHKFPEAEPRIQRPDKVVRIEPLTEAELHADLKLLPGWEPVESFIPGDYPKSRHELRKVYVFRSFKSAVEFMASAVAPINQMKHHPRWENQWRSLTVYLTTWDIGDQISRLDIDMAKLFDRLYEERVKLTKPISE
ncbi:MAG: 4a-hydroxytetrahydrobiopterin dehydratase [Candidatus Korobacteraceae bacterium]|jgi:pterin-4a-carbinolamine dehydratase